jgi:membrane-bound lytic murein transglycosylase B
MSNLRFIFRICLVAFLIASSNKVLAITTDSHPALADFINDMQTRHQFSADALTRLFREARIRDSIIKAISRPAERKPWYQYRPIFLTNSRIEGGVEFWHKNRDSLEKAQDEYGVDPAIIVAIIGVETRYGRHSGRYRVLDALTTLAFAYPPRSKFFRKELEQYLIMTRDFQLDPLSLKGSYAGAMGQPQFISSSYRNFAVDFDGDGLSDIWQNPTDAIGSVANYFKEHGWQTGKPVAFPVTVSEDQYLQLGQDGLKPHASLETLRAGGIQVPEQLPGDMQVKLLRYENPDNYEYWLGLDNFYVITRYNHSALYAMAVFQLSEEIRSQYLEELNSENDAMPE